MDGSADATGKISPNKKISLFYSKDVFLVGWSLLFKVSSLEWGKGLANCFFTCGSLLYTLLTAKWISGEEMQLPQCCTRGKSGRPFRVSRFVQPLTLPSRLCYYARVTASCHSFHGLAKANCSYQGAMCFWPALSLK